jgi:DNA-binding GntR family transcriptional regulator
MPNPAEAVPPDGEVSPPENLVAPLRQGSSAAPESLGPEVYKTILSSIISLRIAPDSRIAVDALARELGVSPTPIREALVRLEAEGLVVKTHLRGYRAAPKLTREDFESLFDIRLVLEPHAAMRAAEHRTEEQIAELREVNDRMRKRREIGDTASTYAEFAALDAQFHDTIAAASANRLIQDSLSRLHAHLHLFRAKQHSGIGMEAIREHERIIDAVANQDRHLAEAAARSHLERSLQRMIPVIEAD